MMMIFLIYFLMCVFSACGLFCDKPCDVCPKYTNGIPKSDNFITTVNVPAECTNGTFNWHYPKGHTMLHFQNVKELRRTICIRDSQCGDFFNITEKATNERLGPFDDKISACFNATFARDIVIQVTAHPDNVYFGGFEYRIYR
ncbi:uncharacterized protein LOC132750199 [Ruditapes philippinarum]|uniref:uncharacterized protein LOC132750199 n=1 Tax=Ruditapes philippinarum TaxID=129788 RepID=UPI00295BAE65|nr:uncharacterized protein LOC132750199 [Ruditapes philippinarum]